MGLEMFKLVEPHLELHFSENEDTEETDVEVDKLMIHSKNTSLSEYVVLHNPRFEVESFDPQLFRLEAKMEIGWEENPHSLMQKVNGVFREEDIEADLGMATLSSRVTEVWWPFGHDMVEVQEDTFFNTTMQTELGRLKAFTFESELNMTFDGEPMIVKFEGSSGGELNEFCYMFYDIPVVSIAKVFMHVVVGENGTEVAKNFL
jgi:hypothetical protein